ncbi:MAG: hypothetical protein M3247_06735, partial [Thermoproteota archaeon]|nr:hypothetical protein [Acidobacteriota bacterium]MDQ3903317.1 hypothetical protein [Thermoproteota archaeon]
YRVEDAFTTAKHAEWAGDVEYCRKQLFLLRELTDEVLNVKGWHPLALLRDAGETLGRSLIGREPAPSELVIETDHLRGVVWQTERREFELLAYLTNSAWEDLLYRNAQRAAKARNVLQIEPEEEIQEELLSHQRSLLDEGEHAPEIDEGSSISWEENVEGLLCVVTVADLCLIQIKGIWIDDNPPQSSREVVRRFREILERIELPVERKFRIK